MRAREEQTDRYTQQELLRRCELIAVVHLFPHVEVVVRPGVEFEGDATNPMEHQVGPEHVGEVCEGPRSIALDAGDDGEEDFESHDEDYVDGPGTCKAKAVSYRVSRTGQPVYGVGWSHCRRERRNLSRFTERTFSIHPVRIEVWYDCLIAQLLHRFLRLLIQQAARPPPPRFFGSVIHPSSLGW